MNIKSLLIGSAAATVAATGAQAADPIVVPEPEPMEYVRVCDVYGAGFFYIPGTETCLNVGGMVRYQIGASNGDFGDSDGWSKYARGELDIDARSETEFGTLRGWIRLRGTSTNGPTYAAPGLNDGDAISSGVTSSGVNLQQAYISLGGFTVGMSDSIYDVGLHGEQDRGYFPDSRVHFMSYTFDAANGFYTTVSLEEADEDYDWTPNVVGNIGVAQGWGSADLYGAYDATAEEFALKGIVRTNLTDVVFAEALATYESGISFYSVNPADGIFSTAHPANEDAGFHPGAEWSVAGTVGFNATPKLTASVGGAYYSNVGHDFAADLFGGEVDAYNLGTTLDYEIVENFDAKLAVNYTSFDTPEGDADQWHGFLRLQRNF